jgi:hypothetical protein
MGPIAIAISPQVKFPVQSLTRPKTYGPKNPPRLPTALISAIPPAAAVPDNIAVGSDQKHGPVDELPIEATTSIVIVKTGSVINAQAMSPTAPID